MRKILLLFLAVISFSQVIAQGITTASLIGKITTGNKAATVDTPGEDTLPGATIVATHEPSGTTFGTVSLSDGKYVIPNMRVGGPYKVEVSFVGYQTQTLGGIYLKLSEPFTLNVPMVEESTALSDIIILGTEDKLMNGNLTGSVTNIGTGQIMAMPSISRSINDMTRMTPQATSTSNGAIGGGNYRQNYITVDGSDFNNTFGIGTNLPANGSPISLDAIEEISVSITPYDVRQANFVGSSINAITRSGTNQFSGSAYTFFRNENQQGNSVGEKRWFWGGGETFARQPLDIKTYGLRLGGPIIKNKLFFFVNYEQTKETRPGQTQVAATAPTGPGSFGSSPEISRPLASTLDTYSTYLRDTYGYETGPYQGYDNESGNTRFVARIDWNINKNHRINLRYSQVESKNPAFPSGSTTGTGFNFATGQGRLNNNALFYKNAGYYQEANFYSWALEANSLFGKVANTLRATYTHQNDPRSSDSNEFPFVDILDGSASNNIAYTSFGYDPFTFGNLRDVTSYSLVDFITLTKGIHTITVGVQADFQLTKNGFQRFGTGHYVFASWDDFANGAKPINYAITYSLLPGFEQAFPSIGYNQYSAYGQDEIAVNDRLKITAGLRFDLPTFPSVDEIKTHPLVAPLTFEGGKKMDSGVLPDTRVMISPRIGFNWDVKGDRSLQVRGGTGIFTGRVPTVWLVAQSGDAGLLQFTQTFTGQTNTPGPFQIERYRPTTPPAAGTAIPGTFSAIDSDFKFPQAWKNSIAVDKKLPFGLVASLEGILTKDLNIATGYNPNIKAGAPLNVDGYPDNRPIHAGAVLDRYKYKLVSGQASETTGTSTNNIWNPILLSNANKGYYMSLTAKIEKQLDKGLSAFIAYTKSGGKVLYDGQGDQLFNTWSLNQIVSGANSPEMSTASYIVPDRIVAAVTYRKEYLKVLASSISLFWEGSVAGRYSYTYSADFNRDGQPNDLIYIPKDPSEITFTDFNYGTTASPNVVTAQQQSAMFFDYIEQDKYLKKHKGEYAERNGATMPWRNQIDLRFTQDVFTNLGGRKNTLQFTIDIFNFGNLLNSSWGIFKTVNATGILVPTNVNALAAGGTVRPTFRLQTDRGLPVSTTYRDTNSIASTYYMQFGLRYIFN